MITSNRPAYAESHFTNLGQSFRQISVKTLGQTSRSVRRADIRSKSSQKFGQNLGRLEMRGWSGIRHTRSDVQAIGPYLSP